MTTVRRKMNRQFKRTSQKKRSGSGSGRKRASRNHRSNRGGRYRNRTQRGGAVGDVDVFIDVLKEQWKVDPNDTVGNKNKLRILTCIESVVKGEIPPFPVSPAEIKTELEKNPAIKELLSNQGFKDSIKKLDSASGGDFFKWLGLDSASMGDIPVETLKTAIKKITDLTSDATRVIIEDALSLTLSDKTRDTIQKIVKDLPLPFPAKIAINAGMVGWNSLIRPLVKAAIKKMISDMKTNLTAQIAAAGPAPAAPAAPAASPATSAPATAAAVEPVAPAAAPAAAPAPAPATSAPATPATTAAPAAAPATTAAPAGPIVTGVYPKPPPSPPNPKDQK